MITGREIVWTTDQAQSEGRYLAAQQVEATIFNYAIWAWPHYSAIAAQFVPGRRWQPRRRRAGPRREW